MNSASVPPFDITAWRREFPILERAVPMNNCSQGPQARRVRNRALEFLDSWNERGMDWDAWLDAVAGARSTFAEIINADPDEVAVLSSVSDAASALMSALDFSGRRRTIVATEGEFPTIGHVALAQERRGARVLWAPLRDGGVDTEKCTALIDEETAIVCATHAYYLTGALLDVEAVVERAHAQGALALIDAYQSAGAVPIDVRSSKVDALVAGTQKYLLGTPGIAFLYLRREVSERLHPTVTGWFGREQPFAFEAKRLDWARGAARFDTGTPPAINAYIAGEGMRIIAEVGVANVRAWTRVLSDHLVAGGLARELEVIGPPESVRKGPTTAFRVAGDSAEIEHRMRADGVIASARGPAIRLAPHFYSTLDDCDRALDALVRAREPR